MSGCKTRINDNMMSEGKKDELKKISEKEVSDKIVTYYGYFEEYSLKNVAKRCVRLIISEYYKDLCYDSFKLPSHEDMKTWILEEMKQSFDEKIMPLIEQTNPDLSDDEIDDEIKKLEILYEKEHKEQLDSAIAAGLKELRIRVKGLQKELKALKRKYTM